MVRGGAGWCGVVRGGVCLFSGLIFLDFVNRPLEQSCDAVNAAILNSFSALSGLANCGSGEICGYSLKSSNAAVITGTHETPVAHYLDDLTFAFTSDSEGCNVGGYSTSEVWYAVLDDGTKYVFSRKRCQPMACESCLLELCVERVTCGAPACSYCNLHNLVSNTGLTFKEFIDTSDCTQYSIANCAKY